MRVWTLLVSITATAAVASNSYSNNRYVPDIDELLAQAGDMQDGKNSQAANPASGKKILGGDAELEEFDIVKPLPIQSSGNGGPDKTSGAISRRKRSAVDSSSRYWPNARVPYEMASNMRSESIRLIVKAMEEYHRLTCIKWVPKTSRDSDYVYFQDDSSNGGCWSYVGKTGGRQPLNLRQPSGTSFGCIRLRTAVHEMLHALGVYHQQSRTDRDKYVTINYNNLQDSRQHNFQIRANTEHYGVPYDYRSVMHYGRTTFSKDGRSDTLTTADPEYQALIGKSPTLSFGDIHLLNEMYKCPAKANCPSKTCKGGFQGADCNCYCKSTDYDNPIEKCGSLTSGAMTCETVNIHCKCSVNGCNGIQNSYCNYADDSCECKSGYQAINGQCLAKTIGVTCDDINKVCDCSMKGSSSCDSISNSYCDWRSNSCICKEDFYNRNGYCVSAPVCNILNSDCKCHTQGGDACSRIVNSVCDSSTGACRCRTSSMEQGGTCINGDLLVSDGSTVAPFKDDPSCSVMWTPTAGADNPSKKYLTTPNSYYLFASGYAGDCAQIGTDFVTPTGNALCFSVGANLNKAKLMVYFSTDYATSWKSLSSTSDMGYYYSWSMKIHTDKPIKFDIKARATRKGYWSAQLDPIIVGDCSDQQYSVDTSI